MGLFRPELQQVNAFLEDTCVLVTLSYLLSRSPLLPTLFDRRRPRRGQLALALLFGLMGASELLFPGDRRPYVPFTLVAGLVGYAGGLRLALASAGVMLALALPGLVTGGAPRHPALYGLSLLTACPAGAAVAALQRARTKREAQSLPLFQHLGGALTAGAAAEALHVGWRLILVAHAHPPGVASVPANGFGCLVVLSILRDAYERREAALRLVRSERELASSRLSQLNQLQARLHPHFLFNALTAIAGLCVVSPPQAERAVVTLGALLRRFLRAPSETQISLREELVTVRAYLALEQLRLGDRLCVSEDIPEETLPCPVPSFCLQIPVENAVQHGIAPSVGKGHVCIVARRRPAGLTLAVLDDGAGTDPLRAPGAGDADLEGPPHGLGLLASRLRLAGGRKARMRLGRRRTTRGAVFVLRLPL